MKAKERHEIKTDRFIETAASVQDFLIEHFREISFIVGAILIIVLGWFGISWFIDSRENAAAEKLNQALSAFKETNIAFGLLTLQQQNAQTETSNESLKDVEKQLLEVVDQHGGTSGAVIAHFYLGSINYLNNNLEQAREHFEAVIDARHPYYSELATSQLGQILEQEGDYKSACEIYRKLADSGTSEFPLAYFAWKTGICLEELGNSKEAIRYYQLAKESESLGLNAAISVDIERRLERLNSGEG